jgi:hypothetical protein
LATVPLEDAVVDILAWADVTVFSVVAAVVVAGVVVVGGDDPPDLEKQLPNVQVRSNQAMTVFS